MRQINLETWPRYEHFKVFSAFDQPHFSMCAPVDLTTFYPALKQYDISFTVAMVYVISRAANAIPEFRQRIRPGMVVEHEVVHPSVTILADEEVFGFCLLEYHDDFADFAANAAHPADSVPRFAWGKHYWEGERLKMPLSVQGHHALMDGIHMGRFYAEVQNYLHSADFIHL